MGAQISWGEVAARVVAGHGVASGRSADPRFPDGTIQPQLPFLRAAVPDLDDWTGGPVHPGTINLALGRVVTPGKPEFRLPLVRWSAAVPAETFFLSRAMLGHGGVWHPAWLYMPDPLTKPDHHQPGDVVELLAGPIPELAYGDAVLLRLPPGAVRLEGD